MSKVLIIDSSILCVYLQILKFTSCGPDQDQWTYERIKEKLEEEKKNDTSFPDWHS